MKTVFYLLTAIIFVIISSQAQNYAGSQYCQICHDNSAIAGTQYTEWSKTLHNKIHLLPNDSSMRPLSAFVTGQSISMGASYANAVVILSKVGSDFFAQVGTGGTTYKIAYTYGYGYKQRYLIKIDTAYYMLPIQYNLNKYLDNSSGTWITYNPGNWFNADGTIKPFDNAFRKKSWDKNCMGCHVTGGKVEQVVVGADTAWKGTWANNSSHNNIVVGCESCHGPSSTHSGGPTGTVNPRNLPNKERKLEVCGQCHNRASSWRGAGLVGTHEFPKDEINNTYFKPGDVLANFVNFATPPNQAGGPGTWPDLVSPRQHHQQYQDILGSKHYDNPFVEVTCFTCHVSHKPTPNKHQITDSLTVGAERFKVSNDDNTLCLACHATHGPFEGIAKAWVMNPVQYNDSIGAVVKAHTRHNLYDPTNQFTTGGIGRCSKCHMTTTASSAKSYDIHTHRFGVLSPYLTKQYASVTSPTQGMLNSCAAGCHRNPSGSTAAVPTFGITNDTTFTKWNESTDIALADTLWNYWQQWGWTGVKEISQSAVPQSYYISQNYPNPFNPTTSIKVDLPKDETVRLKVYNINGKEVTTLMSGNYKAGKYEVTWNGHDGFGLLVATGVYIYRLEAGDFVQSKKMVLMK